jgi:hypothetical protein
MEPKERRIVSWINEFEARTAREEHTDPDEVWALLRGIRNRLMMEGPDEEIEEARERLK